MVDGIRIDDLNPTVTETRDHVVAAMADGLTVQLTVAQVLGLIALGDISEFLTGVNVSTTGGVALNDALALRLKRDGSNFANSGEKTTFLDALVFSAFMQSIRGITANDLPFLAVPVGGIIMLPTDLAGVVEPSTGSPLYRFAKLTAGLTGGGGYNNGVLSGETVSGSAPLILAYATVALVGSPIYNQNIRLLNTEGRFMRPGTVAGTVRNDQVQDHYHTSVRELDGEALSYGSNSSYSVLSRDGTLYNGVATSYAVDARVGTETYPKHIEMTAYMRLK